MSSIAWPGPGSIPPETFPEVSAASILHLCSSDGTLEACVCAPFAKRLSTNQFGSAGSVRFLIPACHWRRQVRAEEPVAYTVIAYSHLLGDSLLCDHSRSSTCTCAPSMCVLIRVIMIILIRIITTGRKRFGSVRFGIYYFPGSACVFWTRRGSVRFGSVRFRVRFRPIPELNGSVRLGRFGSVSNFLLMDT